MVHTKRYSEALLLAMLTLVVGCASQQTPRELLASGYAVIEVAAYATARLQVSAVISQPEAVAIKAELQGVQNTLDNARVALQSGNPTDAHATLSAALSVAVSVLERVQAKEVRP